MTDAPLVIRLTDGTLLSSTTTAPSKRSIKNKSGRAGRRTYNGQRTLSRAGGYSNDLTAIAQDVLAPLCRVRTETRPRNGLEALRQGLMYSRKEYTWDVGGSCSTGYIGGRGA